MGFYDMWMERVGDEREKRYVIDDVMLGRSRVAGKARRANEPVLYGYIRTKEA